MNTDNFTPRRLPVGIQSFEKLRSEGFVYVDKTALIYKLIQAGVPCFLSRPRRFGKSLLLSTIEAYFKGKRELFRGLAMEQLEKNWYEYPVLHLSLNAEKYDSKERLADMLERQLQAWEQLYQTGGKGITYSGRFMTVIKQAYEQTGRRVVVLIDEYDKPLLGSFDNSKLQDDFRETLTAFYTVLKDADPWLQFVLITGVTKFAQMGIFSNLNQLSDISFDLDYNTLCGMTLPEIETTFVPELEAMALKQKLSHEALLEKMTRLYDGYRFTDDEEFTPMYNPFSVLNALMKRAFGSYWFGSGTPTFLVNMLKKTIRPEFLNRIDETIMFLPLTEPEIKQIVVLQIKSVQKMLSGNGVELVLTNAAIDFLANAGYDPEFGARPVKRAIQHYLLNDLSKKLLAQEVDRSKPITVDANTTDDGLVFRN